MAETKASGGLARAQDGPHGPARAGAASGAAPGPSGGAVTPAGLPLGNLRVLAAVAALSAVTLTAELALPEAIWAAALHMAVVFLGVWLATPRDVALLGGVASLLLVAGALLGLPPGAFGSAAGFALALVQGPELANRLMVLLGIWALVGVLAGAKAREAALRTRVARETARRRAREGELARRHSLPRPAALPERIQDHEDLGHEVRTQLNAIVGFSDAARQELFGPHSDPRYRDYMGHINEAAWALARILERTLAAEPLPETQSEPGTRRAPGAAEVPEAPQEEDSSPHCAPKAVNQ